MENFTRQEAEAVRTSIEETESSEKKVTKYQELANKALSTFYSRTNELGWSWAHEINLQARDIIAKKFQELNRQLTALKESWSHIQESNARILDSMMLNSINMLISLWTITSKEIDDLVDTGLTDFWWQEPNIAIINIVNVENTRLKAAAKLAEMQDYQVNNGWTKQAKKSNMYWDNNPLLNPSRYHKQIKEAINGK